VQLFHRDLYRKLRLAEITKQDIWAGKQPPTVLSLQEVLAKKEALISVFGPFPNVPSIFWRGADSERLSCSQLCSVKNLRGRGGPTEWDKDDDDALTFVAAAANLRMEAFHINRLSRYDIKAKAGNIIPAIATTNAIIAGQITMEVLKVLGNRLDDCKSTFLLRKPSNKNLLLSISLDPQNPKCFVCSTPMISLHINIQESTLRDLLNILKEQLSFHEPSISCADLFVMRNKQLAHSLQAIVRVWRGLRG